MIGGSLNAPEDRATLLGGWFVLAFVANLSAGLLGSNFGTWPPEVFFAVCAGVALTATILLSVVRTVDLSSVEGSL